MTRLASILLLLVAALPTWAGEAGTVTRLRGGAEAVTAGVSRSLEVGMAIREGDLLRTAPDGRLEVGFVDGTLLTLGGAAALTVDAMVYDSAAGTGKALLGAAEGAFLIATGAIAKLENRPFAVRTPFASIGIRGTRFWGGPLAGIGPPAAGGEVNPMTYEPLPAFRRVEEKGFAVLLIEGLVSVINDVGTADLQPGQGTTIAAPDAPPSAPSLWPEDRVRRAFATVEFR
ncbi:MAG: FecR family protein [Magnetospirillum sp. WYHS-4]